MESAYGAWRLQTTLPLKVAVGQSRPAQRHEPLWQQRSADDCFFGGSFHEPPSAVGLNCLGNPCKTHAIDAHLTQLKVVGTSFSPIDFAHPLSPQLKFLFWLLEIEGPQCSCGCTACNTSCSLASSRAHGCLLVQILRSNPRAFRKALPATNAWLRASRVTRRLEVGAPKTAQTSGSYST